ncbi:uncharacterized protein [Euphorbia lathyris]|uniref:uncharacterized protein n=1 Tax=Euphorbia lathyris TaxID=212925 RepID=UPI0033139F56
MASSAIVDRLLCSISPCHSPKSYKNQTLVLIPNPHLLSSTSFLKFNRNQPLPPKLQVRKLARRSSRSFPVIFAAQSRFFKVIQTAWKVGKDGIEAGTSMVPDSVPRPVARISVTAVALAISLFLFKSILSTVFFALATMGFVYFVFIALNKDQGPKGGGGSGGSSSSEDPLEEARRIMEKYK